MCSIKNKVVIEHKQDLPFRALMDPASLRNPSISSPVHQMAPRCSTTTPDVTVLHCPVHPNRPKATISRCFHPLDLEKMIH